MGSRRPPFGERAVRTPRTRRRAAGSRRSWPACARSGTSSRRSTRLRSARRTAEPPATVPSRRAVERLARAPAGAGGAPPSPRGRPRRPGARRPRAHGRHRARGARGPLRRGGRRGRRRGRGPARTGPTGPSSGGYWWLPRVASTPGRRPRSGGVAGAGWSGGWSADLGFGLGERRQGHGGHGADRVSPACSPEVSQEVSLVVRVVAAPRATAPCVARRAPVARLPDLHRCRSLPSDRRSLGHTSRAWEPRRRPSPRRG